MACFICSSIS